MSTPIGQADPKRHILSGVIVLLLVGTAIAFVSGCRSNATPADAATPTAEKPQSPETKPAAPVVDVTGSQAGHDFGPIQPGTNHRVTFRLHNDVDRPLRITKTMSDCPCIRVLDRPPSVAARKTGDVAVQYAASSRIERYHGQVIVFTDQRGRAHVRLNIQATVGEPTPDPQKDTP